MQHDPQQKALYAWEDSWWGWNKSLITFKQTKRVIERACRLMHTPAPIIKSHDSRELSYFYPEFNTISMQRRGGYNIPIALHEASHAIAWHHHGLAIQDHGPTFVGIYLDLLEKFKVAPPVALRSSLSKAGIRWINVTIEPKDR